VHAPPDECFVALRGQAVLAKKATKQRRGGQFIVRCNTAVTEQPSRCPIPGGELAVPASLFARSCDRVAGISPRAQARLRGPFPPIGNHLNQPRSTGTIARTRITPVAMANGDIVTRSRASRKWVPKQSLGTRKNNATRSSASSTHRGKCSIPSHRQRRARLAPSRGRFETIRKPARHCPPPR
jgi:hypothetical protein